MGAGMLLCAKLNGSKSVENIISMLQMVIMDRELRQMTNLLFASWDKSSEIKDFRYLFFIGFYFYFCNFFSGFFSFFKFISSLNSVNHSRIRTFKTFIYINHDWLTILNDISSTKNSSWLSSVARMIVF